MDNAKTSTNRRTLELTVQLITAVSVLIGIYLVMVELRQAREMSTVQMVHTRLLSWIEQDTKIYGETMSETLARACLDPQGLTDTEATALDYFFQNRLRMVRVAHTGAILGSFQKGIGIVENWQQLSLGYLQDVLIYPSGQNWLKTNPYWSDKELAKTDEVAAWVQSFQGNKPFAGSCDKKQRFTPITMKE